MKKEIRIGSLSEQEKISDKQLDLILGVSRSHLVFASDLKWTDNINIHNLSKTEAREIIRALLERVNARKYIERELGIEVVNYAN